MRSTPKLAIAICSVALATCCPTLWLQVTKTEPAPWPELPTPDARAFVPPTQMQNRFDVLAKGAMTRDAEDFREVDPRDNAKSQRNAIAKAMDQIAAYGVTLTCASDKLHTGECVDADGPCSLLDLKDAPSGNWLLVNGHLRQIADRKKTLYNIELGVEGVKGGDPVEVCYDVGFDTEVTKPLLSFIHASDVQLRDPSVLLTDRQISRKLDWIGPLSSFEYDEDLAYYNQYLFEAVVETINKMTEPAGPNAPSFAIHTGDSVDSNMMSELLRFHRVIDRLRIPFFNVLGNHDVLVFGNLTPTDEVAARNDHKCTPISALLGKKKSWFAPDKLCVDATVKACASCTKKQVEFVASTKGHTATHETFIEALTHDAANPAKQFAMVKRVDNKTEYCKEPRILYDTFTTDHGFSLSKTNESDKSRGYYAFTRPLDGGNDRQAVFVVLDGEELVDFEGGIYGHVGHEQLAWLRSVLSCVQNQHRRDLVFVFAHQPLSLIQVDAQDAKDNVDDVLSRSKNVVGYLYGHHHEHAICRDRRVDAMGNNRTCTSFWEVQTASLVEFPQEVRLVRIKQFGDGNTLGYLEVSTFGETLIDPSTQLARFVGLARRGAERDHCVTHQARCSDDKRPYREDGNDTAARLFFRMP